RAEKESWEDRDDLTSEFPQLTSEEPRIVFVASGGVFRGPFHAGMINAMLAVKIKPDLIVGASVGTLVGGALAATLGAQDHHDSLRVLEAVVKTFQEMDGRIAFTKTLKNAARELGIRSRMVDLAPYELRKKILEGTKSDPGFAVTGTPPILIDAISDILLIPHGDTAKIAAQFVAGHFTDATRRLIKGLRTETLRRLDIAEAVMGASLLEPTARRLLGTMLKKEDGSPWYDMNSRQPYKKARIAIFGTSTDLLHRQPVLLGRYKWQLPSYDFVNACLASSAFPAVFAPRKDEQIFPGLGDPQLLYSDGGMFDNLPISPALEILSASQKQWIRNNDAVRALWNRIDSPDLFIAGSLEANARSQSSSASMQESKTDSKEFDTLVAIKKRVSALQKNLKIRAFEQVSEKISVHLHFLWQIVQETRKAKPLAAPKPVPGNGVNLQDRHQKNAKIPNDEYLNGLVNAVLLPVYPTDSDHLNGTFQFCNSLGKNKKVVNQSMADGCFQTLRELTLAFSDKAKPTRAQAIDGLSQRRHDPIPVLTRRPEKLSGDRPQDDHGYYCPFFVRRVDEKDVQFACPFSETENAFVIFQSCRKDKQHRKIYKKELLPLKQRQRPAGQPGSALDPKPSS
ncbi:MAG: patatin-like phospholipase family protein, partial [Candidatus Angelobacter sp.]